MPARDDFSKPVIRAVALRAGYFCSFPNCGQLTVGPSDESPTAVTTVGVAAHIHAAASGGRRYLSSMTAEERSGIENAIWLCVTHSTLIDRDEVTYSADILRRMKSDHESRIGSRVAKSSGMNLGETDLIAIGPDVIATGEFLAVNGKEWTFKLEHFVAGDLASLVRFGDQFPNLRQMDRFVLLNSIGEGRTTSGAPRWFKKDGFIVVEMNVEAAFPRCTVQELKKDLCLEDLSRTVSGVNALPQKILLSLGHIKGERWDNFGSRVSEFYSLFGTTAWFERLVKLETVRLASIPYGEGDEAFTPFQCVERVLNVRLLSESPEANRLRTRFDLDVRGLGVWSKEIDLFVKGGSLSDVPDLQDMTPTPAQGSAPPVNSQEEKC